LKLIIKSSSEGALEAINKSLCGLKGENCKVEIFDSGVGNITLQDVEKASVAKAIVLGFEVGMEKELLKWLHRRKLL
jgi:translation initiation factor IF-2